MPSFYSQLYIQTHRNRYLKSASICKHLTQTDKQTNRVIIRWLPQRMLSLYQQQSSCQKSIIKCVSVGNFVYYIFIIIRFVSNIVCHGKPGTGEPFIVFFFDCNWYYIDSLSQFANRCESISKHLIDILNEMTTKKIQKESINC